MSMHEIIGIPEEDMEARHALRVLFDAEEVKMSEDDFLKEILSRITDKREILDRIEALLNDEIGQPSVDSTATFINRLIAAR